MATKSSSLAYKHWHRILRLWPTDPVRPATVSFQHIMRQRLSKIQPSPSSSSLSPSPSPSTAAESIKANEALAITMPPSSSPPAADTWNESHQLRQVNALYSLLENRYATASPLQQNLRKPTSDPEYYDVLVRELEEAPTRSWLGGVLKRIKGSLRFS